MSISPRTEGKMHFFPVFVLMFCGLLRRVFDSMFGGVSVGQNIYLMSAANSIPLLGGAPGIHNVYVFVSAPTAVSFKPCFGV